MSKIYERINHFAGLLKKASMRKSERIENIVYKECGYSIAEMPKLDESFKSFSEGLEWGGVNDSHAWFMFDIPASKDIEGCDIYLEARTNLNGWDATNPQFLLFIDSKPIQGMDTNHTMVRLDSFNACKGMLYGYSGMEGAKKLKLDVSILHIDSKIERLYYDIIVPFEMLGYSDVESKEYSDILFTLNDALNLLDLRVLYSQEFYRSVDACLDFLKANLYNKLKNKNDSTVTCVGHTHIDIAWLWSIAQTREKAVRSFSTVLKLMDEYPEYKFFSSQPILYKMIKEDMPKLYEKIKQKIKEGRWEAEGSMWVEADCNLISGESLVRQVLYGKKFFKEEFGIDNKILWLPDVFGYSAALPQILKKSGVDYFVTSKISWNDTNKIPYDTFNWKGIDGTEILTYFITTQDKTKQPSSNFTTYVGMATPKQVSGAFYRYQQKEISDEVMLLYGFGDGGGGPTKNHLEYLRRMDKGLPLCPRTNIDFALDFLNRLKTKANTSKRLPKWSGELYLEYHRGTYTSIAKNKKNNRKSEFMQMNAEAVSVMNNILFSDEYPKSKLYANWETILTNQFHDIIPGSSIKQVYDDTDKDYSAVFQTGEKIISDAHKKISQSIKTDGGVLVFNPNSFSFSGYVNADGENVFVSDVPPKGYKVLKGEQPVQKLMLTKNKIENESLRVEFDDSYNIIGIFDKDAKRQLIKSGEVAGIRAYEDLPFVYDAWEISEYYREKSWLIEDVQSVEMLNEPSRAGFVIKRKFIDSLLEQRIYLKSGQKQIVFENSFDWKNEHILLKAEFPVSLNATRAVYDIQFGAIDRPATKNDSWEQAKFEVCAHKFADLSEYGYGVAILNDCKYGHAIHDGLMSLTLLKCPTYPNEDADKEIHNFTYMLIPHEKDYREAGVVQTAYALNAPPKAYKIGKQDGTLPSEFSLMRADSENIIIETVKQAEDNNDIIVRCYEAYNKKTSATLNFGFKIKDAYICDLLENKMKKLSIKDNSIELNFNPYEINTIRIIV